MTAMTMTVMTLGHLFFFQRLSRVLFIKSNYLNIYNYKYIFVNDDKNRSVSSVSSSSIEYKNEGEHLIVPTFVY